MLVEDLKRFPIFEDLDEVEIRKVFQFIKHKRFQKGLTIFPANSLWAGFFYIMRGTVELRENNEAGESKLVDILKAGEFIGERTLFGDVVEQKYLVKAVEPVEAFWINTMEYRRLQNSGPMLLTKIMLRLIILLSNEFRQRNTDFAKAKKELETLQNGG
jgi:CRP/FNR family transcriptional regulator